MKNNKIVNFETIKEQLFYGLPDSRIAKVASKVTVVSDNGTRVVLKDRNINQDEVPVFLFKPIEYVELANIIRTLDHKEVVVTSAVYRSKEIRKLLEEI